MMFKVLRQDFSFNGSLCTWVQNEWESNAKYVAVQILLERNDFIIANELISIGLVICKDFKVSLQRRSISTGLQLYKR